MGQHQVVPCSSTAQLMLSNLTTSWHMKLFLLMERLLLMLVVVVVVCLRSGW
jgi:hypothetical protein